MVKCEWYDCELHDRGSGPFLLVGDVAMGRHILRIPLPYTPYTDVSVLVQVKRKPTLVRKDDSHTMLRRLSQRELKELEI